MLETVALLAVIAVGVFYWRVEKKLQEENKKNSENIE